MWRQLVGQLPHTPSSSGELQPLPELALCVLIVVTCWAVVVECSTCGVYGVAVRCTSVVVFVASVGQLPHTPSSSGELQPLSEPELCVLIVDTCLAVAVECA